MKNKILAIALAVLVPGFAAALPRLVSFITNENNVLVYCPPTDDAGCERIIAAVGGGAKAYDGNGGTVDLRSADLSAYTALIVPSLADGDAGQPYGLLRDEAVAAHLGQSLLGRRVFWSGAPDLGSDNRAAKDALIARLATYASSNHANVGKPGLVVMLDRSSSNRYGWVHSMTGVNLVADPAIKTYSAVRAVTATGTAIVNGAAYANMASFGFYLPQGAAGIRMDAIGQTQTSVGGQIVLMTHPGANEHEAVIATDRDDYPPGDTVVMTGAGFVAGENVALTLQEDPEVHELRTFMVAADSTGGFVFTGFSPEEHDVGVRFVLIAVGETSGRRAETTFTDDKNSAVAGAGTGSGTITGTASFPAGTTTHTYNCTYTGGTSTGTCSNNVNNFATVVVTATAAVGSTFAGWSTVAGSSGCTSVVGATCTMVMGNTARSVIATFNSNSTPTTTTVTSSSAGNTSTYGQSVTFTATVTGSVVNVGNVAFRSGGTTCADGAEIQAATPVNGSGVVTYTTSALTFGSHTIRACYAGSGSFQPSSGTVTQTVNKATATIVLSNLSHTYNSSAKSATATPTPSGLAVAITYDGSATAPTDADSYDVVATINDTNYQGTATGTLTISPALVTATGGSGSAAYDGSTKSPSGCQVSGPYVGDLSCTNNPGTVGPNVGTTSIAPDVTGTGLGNFSITPLNGSYTISQAHAVGTATDGGGSFNGSAFTGTGACSNGLTPVIAYSGGSAPTNAGSTTFTVTCGDGGNNYIDGVDEGAIVITAVQVAATAGSGSATYDGSTKSPSACSLSGSYLGDLACTNNPASVGPGVGTTPIAPSVTGTGIGTNFIVTPTAGSYTISQAQATATAVDGGGTFNGSAFTGSGTCSNGLTPVIAYSGGSAPTNAGTTTFTVTCGDGGNNYINGVDEGEIVISPVQVSATAGSGSATFDGSTKSPSACSLNGSYLGDLACTNNPASVGPGVGTTPIAPSVTGTGIGTNFIVTPTGGSYTINQAQATATAVDGGGTFNGSAFTGSGTCSNGLTPVIAYSGGSAPTNAGTTTFTVTCGDGGNNYINGVDEGEIVISPVQVSATAGSGSATYDGSTKSPSACSLNGTYLGDLACTNSPASVGPNAGTTSISPSVTGTGIGSNFIVTPTGGSYTINQAQATATAVNGGGTFNATAFTGSGTCSNGLTPAIAYSGGSAPTNAGTTTFTVTCGDGGNNFINGVDEGEIVISPVQVSATAGSGSATYDGSTKSPSACSLNGSYLGDLACTNSPASVGPNAGTTSISPSVTGTGIGSNFIVTPTGGSYTINQAQATATAVNGGGTFNATAFTGSGTCSNGLTPVIAYSGGSAPINAGSTTFTVTCGDGGNNFIDGVDEGAIVIAKANATVNVSGFSGTYDGASHGATGSASGVSSEDLSSLLNFGASYSNAPGGNANWSFAGNDNYNSQNGIVAIAIAKKGVTASISASNKPYDGSTTATMTTCTVNGKVGSDDVSCGGGSATFDNANAGTGKTVSANGLSLSGAQSGNYDLTPTTSATTAAITPKDVTTSITASNKPYDGNTTATIATCTVNGKVGTDAVNCGGTAAFASANAGTNINVSSTNMSLGGAASGNYNLTSPNAATTANITAAPVTVSISASASARQYTDNLSVTVSVAAVNTSLSSQITGSLTGVAGTQTFVTGTALSATGSANVTLLPGPYTLTGTFVSTNPNFQSGTPATQPLTVLPEDATPKYVGDTWLQATSTGAATITLSAIVYDDSDGMTGSVANARVTFVDVLNGNSPLGTCKDVRVDITDATNPSQGKATCAWTVTLGKTETSKQVTVGFAIAGSHKNKDAVATKTAVVTITRNAPYTMTGGGAVAGAAPSSMWAGAVGGAEFGLSMSYTNKLTNPQGSVWVKFNVGGVNYLAKSNSLLNFSVDGGGASSIFSAKANIINMETGASVDGNSIIQLSVVDGKGTIPGTGDQIAITVSGKTGGVVYSNRWDRGTAKTVLEALTAGSGNIAINSK